MKDSGKSSNHCKHDVPVAPYLMMTDLSLLAQSNGTLNRINIAGAIEDIGVGKYESFTTSSSRQIMLRSSHQDCS